MKRVLVWLTFASLTLVPMARALPPDVTYSISGTPGLGGWYVSGTVTVTFRFPPQARRSVDSAGKWGRTRFP